MARNLWFYPALIGVFFSGYECAAGVGIGTTGAVKERGKELVKAVKIASSTPAYIATPMILVSAGTFIMGDALYMTAIHYVYLDAFYMDKYEVTFAQYDAFCDATGRTKPSDSGWGRGNRPVINITWNDSKTFCEWAGKRLPTEAEWERACRAGTGTAYSFGDDPGLLGTYAWYSSNSGGMTHPVGEKSPNELGLYDMHGNVVEWVADWAGYNAVLNLNINNPINNPPGPSSGTSKVLRGGSWRAIPDGPAFADLRSGVRGIGDPAFSNNFIGCRCARTP
jgi:formylglycine-generating enzyme required for sulfatase activity